TPQFGLYCYEDMQGFKRLAVEKHKPSAAPLYKFNTLMEGQLRIREMVKTFGLCPRLCNLHPVCECTEHQEATNYNEAVEQAVNWLKETLPTFAIVDTGIEDDQQSCVLIHNGNFAGMGYITNRSKDLQSVETLKPLLEPFQDNDFIRNLVFRHAQQYPHKCVLL
ncbi:MAG: DNA polymerase III subunit epsilon, partial [Chitinophagia bacterium]|nr:DNA polymerase III subunit epsilon [Chitinophagia bacterium]